MDTTIPGWVPISADRDPRASILTLLLPLARILPRVIDWRIRSRAFRWYRGLRAIERDAAKLMPSDTATYAAIQRRLDHMESRALNTSMPLSRSDLLYISASISSWCARGSGMAASQPSSMRPMYEKARC